MNARQFNRMQVLIETIAFKIASKHKMNFANACITKTACGTVGCVWGDFVVNMRGTNLKQLNKALMDGEVIKTFRDFSDYITNPALQNLSELLYTHSNRSGRSKAIRAYFGVEFNTDIVFGDERDSRSWAARYKYLVKVLYKTTNCKYDPRGTVFKVS